MKAVLTVDMRDLLPEQGCYFQHKYKGSAKNCKISLTNHQAHSLRHLAFPSLTPVFVVLLIMDKQLKENMDLRGDFDEIEIIVN